MTKKTPAKPGKTKPKRGVLRWVQLLVCLGIAGFLSIVTAIIGAYYYVAPSLPAAETIQDIPLQIPLRVFSRDGQLIEEIGERRRMLVSYEEIPDYVVNAFIAAEDRRFFEHPGIDYQGILRAALLIAKTGEISGGGSTITQQLARDYFLDRERVLSRKIREAYLAWEIEKTYSKEEIMAFFLNKMFFGQRAYGVAAAAQVYYGKTLQELNVAEAATLAGVLPAPSDYNPVRSPEYAEIRRGYVLGRMRDLGFINTESYQAAMEYPVESRIYGTDNELSAPYVAEMVRREMLSRYGEKATSSGYSVITTLDARQQRAANYAVTNGLHEFSRRRGFRGPLNQLPIDEQILQRPFSEWPEDIINTLNDFNEPAQLNIAVVTTLDTEDNSADIVLADGSRATLDWTVLSWARPYIDNATRGPEPESVADILKAGDLIYVMPLQGGGYALAQLPAAQSALVSLDPYDGAITSLVGGLDFSLSKFNRASQSARQPGSSFKPFIYSAALEAGNTLATIVLDTPVTINSSELETLWRPVNYSGRFYGAQRVREALVRSMNLASVRLLLDNTSIGRAVNYLRPFGFNDYALPRNGSLALGGGSASPLDMVQGYATFANGGYAVKPYVIDAILGPESEELYRADPAVVCSDCKVVQQNPENPLLIDPVTGKLSPALSDAESTFDAGAVLNRQIIEITGGRGIDDLSQEELNIIGQSWRPEAEELEPEQGIDNPEKLAERIVSAENAFLIQDAMRDVIRRGTGVRARVLNRNDLSGKTGTSNDRRDAWFAGFNSKIVSVVWVGYDDDTPLGPREEGSRTALPIWINFMRIAAEGLEESQMPMPPGVVTVRISRTTGCPVGVMHPAEDTLFEHFADGTVPVCENEDQPADIFNNPDGSYIF